jgi:hypothetical protein
VVFIPGSALSSNKVGALYSYQQDSIQKADNSPQTRPLELLLRNVLFSSRFAYSDLLNLRGFPGYSSSGTAHFCILYASFGHSRQNFQDKNHLI